MSLYFLHRYEDLQSKIKYQNKATYLHNSTNKDDKMLLISHDVIRGNQK